MNFYSYKGQEPQGLPERIRLEDGRSVTALNELTDEELHSYGFIGPIIKPEFDAETQKLIWNGNDYDIINLTEQELFAVQNDKKESIVNGLRLSDFWTEFQRTLFSNRLRKETKIDSEVNVLYTEFLSLSTKVQDIQEYFRKFFLIINFTEQEVLSLSNILNLFQLDYIPTEEFLSSHIYDFDTNSIVNTSSRPFESWIWNGEKWVAPVPYPTDGNTYLWSEDALNWITL